MLANNIQRGTNALFTIEPDCLDRKSWDLYVQSHPSSSNYHRYGWRDVIETSFNHGCFYLVARDNAGDIVGILPLVFMQSRLLGRFLISLPFFNYGGALCGRQETEEALLAEAKLEHLFKKLAFGPMTEVLRSCIQGWPKNTASIESPS